MAFSLIVETGDGLTNSNSYATEAEGNNYFASRLNSDGWDNASSQNREVALVMATRILDDWIAWKGIKANETQALRWPRYSVYDQDGFLIENTVIPQWLKEATFEEAIYLLDADRTSEPDTKGFKELSVGSLKLVIDKMDRDSITVIPDMVIAIVEPYGVVRQRGGGNAVNLVRA